MDKLPIYRVSIDEEYSDGFDLGIELISNVENPAVIIKGVAFSSNENKLSFKDDLKYRIAAPVMIPNDIYRNDDEEYFIRFTSEDIENIAKKFMSNLNANKKVFNIDHSDKMTDSYILEAILVDSENKIKMIKDEYNIDLPKGSFFIVQQFNNKEQYKEMVDSNRTGFSLEGFLSMYLIDENDEKHKFVINKNKNKNKMKKRKFLAKKRVYQTISKRKLEEVAENNDLVIIADEIKEGEKIQVIEDIEDGLQDDFTGEVDVLTDDNEDLSLIIEEGVIIEVIEDEVEKNKEDKEDNVELDEEKEKEKDKVKAEDEEKEKEKDKVKAEDEVENTTERLLEIISDLKAEIEDLKSKIINDETDIEEQSFTQAMSNVFKKLQENI